MLMARATSLVARAHFGDVVLGMEYTPEELGAVGPYAAVDLDYDPDTDRHMLIDPETGEILDDDTVTPRDLADAVDAHTAILRDEAEDAEWLRQARDADDEADGRAIQLDLEEEDGDAET
jgi:hypothetical protein